jgi:hypothetical protein
VPESLETLDEAIAVYEPLAAVRPDAFQPVLSLLHVNRAAEAAGLDPSDASVVALEEAVKQQAALMRGVRIVPPDASNLLVGRYRGLCQRLGREPDPRTIEAMAAMTVGSG